MTAPHGRIIRYFLRSRPWLFGGILLVLFMASLLEGLNILAFFPVFQSLLKSSHPTASTAGGLLNAIANLASWMPFKNPTLSASVLLIAVTLLKCGALLLREGLVAYASGDTQHTLRSQVFRCYADSRYLFFLEHKQGKLIYDALNATGRVGILVQKIPQLLADLLKVLAIAFLLLLAIPVATLALVLFLLLYAGFVHRLSSQVSYHTGQGRALSGTEQVSILNEFLGGVRQILVFGTSRAWFERFHHQSRVFRDLYVRDNIWLAVPRILMEAAVVLLIFGFVAASQMNRSTVLMDNLAVVGVFTMALFQLFPSLTSLGRVRMEVSNLMGDAELVYQALTQHHPRFQGGSRTFQGLDRAMAFSEVNFAYPGREKLLDRLSVVFEKGKVTAVVGPSGGGKTTLVNLLLGLLEPTQGRISVDGMDLREYSLESWHRRIGSVSQDPFIIHASVTENILFGRSGFTSQEVQRAAEIANAHEFVSELPQGYDTLVGERGMKLSGGQQQRIAIARAILSNPEILIFDEATSSLDTISEKWVQSAIEKISHDRTVILIAHRLSTVRHADKIVVLEGGRIAEEGRHQELLNEQGRYFHLVALGDEKDL